MFEVRHKKNGFQSAFATLAIIYHATVRHVRKSHQNAVYALITNLLQTIVLIAAFYLMFTVLGLRGNAIRGDFLLYIMSGIFLFLTHTKAMGAVAGSDGPASPMMLHSPMNTAISIVSSAVGSLYIQLLTVAFVLSVYHVAVVPIHIHNPAGAMAMLLLAWFSGVGVGMVMLALKPWFPGFVGIATIVYSRANMIASGKMFVANTLPGSMLALFDWNPLFHAIDQARGFTFINYNPHYSSISYAFYVSITLVMVGLMGEFYARKNVSISLRARQ